MKIILLTVGQTQNREIKQLISNYVKRIGHYTPFEYRELQDVKVSKSTTEDKQKEMEGAQFLSFVKPGDFVVLLDERGELQTSRGFSETIRKHLNTLQRDLIFIIGGPYGFSKEVYDRANKLLGLSKMTFTHEMARLFFTEQIFRAFTILRGEPYHHD
jgi:23S rRNA (pseudouridine1915-N3)-methyltransferase